MKTLCLTIFFNVYFLSAQAQSVDSLYVVTYTTGPSWNMEKAPSEQPFFNEHSANLGQWRKEGIIKLGARYGEKGMIVISVPSLSHATQLIANDVAVANQLFVADVQRFAVFYDGCVDRPKK
jgi:hypothetical protein